MYSRVGALAKKKKMSPRGGSPGRFKLGRVVCNYYGFCDLVLHPLEGGELCVLVFVYKADRRTFTLQSVNVQ